ncbi:hypothetical protein [Methylobacterium sp. SI9]|uniref:hypothetical protein n=1 Tax=Methylobacterium guangdongense TaxID=3138811 RepID=UPI00313BA605
MKRRSARPFMVEVKHARTPRTALRDAEPQARPDKVLWPELTQAEPKPAPPALEAAPAPRPGPKEPEAPVRRVLPSLVPMFESAAEPEPEPAIEPTPRRGRPRRERTQAVAQPIQKTTPVEPMPEIRPIAVQPEALPPKPVAKGQVVKAQVAKAQVEPGAAARPVTWRRTKELRLGERWKRRLPPYLR